MGKKQAESCQTTSECHVGLSCVPSLSFPFETTCQPLLGSGAECESSTVCKIDNFCWPATPLDAVNGRLTCNQMFMKNDFDIIGFMNEPSKTRLDNSLNAGQFCKSGIAVIMNATAAMCVQISEVWSNFNNFAAKAESPFFCDLSKTYATP